MSLGAAPAYNLPKIRNPASTTQSHNGVVERALHNFRRKSRRSRLNTSVTTMRTYERIFKDYNLNQPERFEVIHVAVGAPGSGKTESLISKLPALISKGNHLILAVPTLALSDDIAARVASIGLACRTINQRCEGIVVDELELALEEKASTFIICTHESIRRVQHSALNGWILVLDELPQVVDYPDYALKPAELRRVLDYTKERDGQLWIIDDLHKSVHEQVSTNRRDGHGPDSSTLGKAAAHIFRLLLSEVDVFIDRAGPTGIRHVRAVEEFSDWWQIISAAIETHVLAANVHNSEFELFAKIRGFQFIKSIFTPPPTRLRTSVTIYPILHSGQFFSKKLMLSLHEQERFIDFLLAKVLSRTISTPLLFANKWAGFQLRKNYVPKDCRGLNKYDHTTEAVILFGGNPSPSDSQGLKYLESKYGINFEESFITTRLLEPSLQAVARTAVRRQDNTNPVYFYVQDERVATYLVSTYFSNATVDWSFAKQLPTKTDGRRLDENTAVEVNRLISTDTPTIQIHRQTGVSPKKIREMKSIAREGVVPQK